LWNDLSSQKKKVIHRDLSARNLLVKMEGNEYLVKVADFGMARAVTIETDIYSSTDAKFAKKWAAPEVIKNTEFSCASDVYSFGICLWEIFEYGTVPFPEYNNVETMGKVLEGERPPQPANCPGKIFRLMKQCWSANPADRPDFENISHTLNDAMRDLILDKRRDLVKEEMDQTEKSDLKVEKTTKVMSDGSDQLIPSKSSLKRDYVQDSTSGDYADEFSRASSN